ncbi:MAG: hypothetical protein RMI91_05845 [Gemmatales bacterium]|nr:hypothetical protein [Gemmatales bacterium]MDW7994158.1 hypothetical protein [Gemmatales bacterium]
MEPVPSESKAGRPGWLRAIAVALLGLCLSIISVDPLIDAWEAGQTWRVALYAVVSLAVIVAAVYFAVRGRRA